MRDPRFVRASYALFAIAVIAAVIEIAAMSGAKPVLLQNTPAKSVVAEARAPLEKDLPTGPLLDLPEPGEHAGRAPVRLGASFEGRDAPVKDPPVFRRPFSGGAPSEPACGNLVDLPASSRAVFPLPRGYFDAYEPGWGSPRPQGGHEGTDLMSPVGTPEFAVTDGTVVEVAGTNVNGWNRLGGYTVMVRAAYDIGPIRKGDLFYYAHLDRKSTLPVGTRVRAGQRVGYAGDTGEGREGTRGKFPSHLHFGWYDADETGLRSKVESGAMDPYPLLLWLEENGGAVSGGADASYCEAAQDEIPTPTKPGERPDMDTGRDGDARPSPAADSGGGSHREHGREDRREHRSDRADDEPAEAADETRHPPAAAPTPDENAPDRETDPAQNEEGDEGGEPDDVKVDVAEDADSSPGSPQRPDHTAPACANNETARERRDCNPRPSDETGSDQSKDPNRPRVEPRERPGEPNGKKHRETNRPVTAEETTQAALEPDVETSDEPSDVDGG